MGKRQSRLAPATRGRVTKPVAVKTAMTLWRQRVQDWYPELLHRAHFLPPVHMNRTEHIEVPLFGHNVLVTEPPAVSRPRGAPPVLMESDAIDDECQQRVLICLQELSETQQEVMFVLSQLQFGHYLNEPCLTAATASTLPRPTDLKSQHKHRGDFDVLIIHREYGLLFGEIKGIGTMFSAFTQQQQDQQVKKKVELAIRQLHKADDVLQHLVSDLQIAPRIQNTLILPNLQSAQLKRVLDGDPQLRQDLCDCLGVGASVDPSAVCFTAESFNSPGQWWQQSVTKIGKDSAMTDDVYLDLVSRFGGPATTVTVFCSSAPRLAQVHHPEVRTPGEGVVETACRFTPVDIVLHPKQVAILNRQQPLVFLTGPPGTGKTLVLVMKALDWVQQGKPVQVVSTDGSAGLAAAYMIIHQIELTAGPAAKRLINIHSFFEFATDRRAAFETLKRSANGGQLFIIADEVNHMKEQEFSDLCTELHQHISGLHIWAASLWHKVKPPVLTEVILTEPLRTPPAVTRFVQVCDNMKPTGNVYSYTVSPSPLPSDGPAPIVVLHQGPEHTTGKTLECVTCGKEVAKVLKRLHVGKHVPGRLTPTSPLALQYRDVLILTVSHASDLHDTEVDFKGNVPRLPSGLLQGLRIAGVPVTVFKAGLVNDVKDLATMSGPDIVVAAYCQKVQGLERKVIVLVKDEISAMNEDSMGRLFAMSRCTGQLIWVKPNESDGITDKFPAVAPDDPVDAPDDP